MVIIQYTAINQPQQIQCDVIDVSQTKGVDIFKSIQKYSKEIVHYKKNKLKNLDFLHYSNYISFSYHNIICIICIHTIYNM